MDTFHCMVSLDWCSKLFRVEAAMSDLRCDHQCMEKNHIPME